MNDSGEVQTLHEDPNIFSSVEEGFWIVVFLVLLGLGLYWARLAQFFGEELHKGRGVICFILAALLGIAISIGQDGGLGESLD